MEVIAFASEDRMRINTHLYVKIACRATSVAYFTLASHTDSHAVADAGGDVNYQVTALSYTTIAATIATRIWDNFTCSVTGWARHCRHHVAEERSLHLLDSTSTVALAAYIWLRLSFGTRALALITQHSGIDGDLFFSTFKRIFERNAGSQ
jgi:hypothetical protein